MISFMYMKKNGWHKMTDLEKRSIFIAALATEEMYEGKKGQFNETAYFQCGYWFGQERILNMFNLTEEYGTFKKEWYKDHPKKNKIEN